MPQPDYSFPSYLAPPTEAQRDQIGLARARQANDNAQTEIAVREAQRKAGVMMRRQIGLSKMKEDVASAVSKGVDPLTARQNALVDNAEWLFSDNPEAVAKITESEMANQVREKALTQAQHAKETATLFNQLKLKQAKELADQHEAALAKQKDLDRQSRERIAGLRGALAPKLGDVDKAEIRSIYKQIDVLQKQHDELDPESGFTVDIPRSGTPTLKPGQIPNTAKRMQLNLEIRKLKDRAKEIEGKGVSAVAPADEGQGPMSAGDDTMPDAPAAKTGRVRVKSPDGKTGTIPESQLQDALKEGYIKVE